VQAAVKALVLTAGLICSLTTVRATPRWKIQYLYDQAGSNFDIRDLACPTALRCVAAGVISDRKDRQQGAVVVTSDGGAHWSMYEVKELPLSLSFLNDTVGWMVTDRGLWATVEGGRSWTKIENHKGILDSYFLDSNRGYIAGASGLFEETTDGGKTWKQLEQADKAALYAKDVVYDSITFNGPHGIAIGQVDPDSDHKWVDRSAGEKPAGRRAIVLETYDGGKNWVSGLVDFDADLGRLRISKQGFALALVVYHDEKAPVASAIFQTGLGKRNSRLIFGEHDRTATDVALLDGGGGVVAAVEPPGAIAQLPIPGKLKMLESRNLKVWQEADVDYRAVAQSAVIAVADAGHMWVATDTGAILYRVDGE
jgi:photosystem II stability/assembly factor-like uncharacterized protein